MGKYDGKKALILGLGVSGQSSSTYLIDEGAEVIAVDRHASALQGSFPYPIVDEDAASLDSIDFIVKSPGVSPLHPLVKKAEKMGIPVLSEMELACRHLIGDERTLFAITGSNGKTTTTMLTTHILNHAGMNAEALGNIGTPLLSRIDSKASHFVVEMSSYQIESLQSAIFSAGVILNITPNHLDRYTSFEEYARAKLKLEQHLKKGKTLYISPSVHRDFSQLLERKNHALLPSVQEKIESICFLRYRDGQSRLAAHDFENLSAAYALCNEVGISDEAYFAGVASFEKPPHRIEFVSTLRGIHFVNDSKATSVDAVKKAVGSISGQIVLIAGGVDKGGSFAEWVPLFQDKVKKVLVIGQAQERIEKELQPHVPVESVSNLQQAVASAWKGASKGDTVLLSPGCSSFDQFRDYQERGDLFKQYVFELGEKI